MEYWTNKVAVISNSGNEIGINIIEKLEEMGMTVIGLCKTYDELKLVMAKFNKSMTSNMCLSKFDGGNIDEVEDVFENIVHNYGSIDILINIINSDFDCVVLEGNVDDFKKIVDTNISLIAGCIRKAAGFMVEKENRGHIMTISDCQNEDKGTLDKTLFTMTKAAVSSMNEILRHEFRYLNANIKTTHMEIGSSTRFEESSPNKSNEIKDIAEMVKTILNTPRNLQINELWLDIGD